MNILLVSMLIVIGHNLAVTAMAEQWPYMPPDHFLFDCQAPTTTLMVNGHDSSPHTISKASIESSGDHNNPELYACIIPKPNTYTFPLSSTGWHFIRLYFFLTSYQGLNISKALFSVTTAQYTLLTTSESSYSSNPLDAEFITKEFCINVDDPVLNLTFTPLRDSPGAYGFVNKIEIVSMPQELYVGHSSKLFTKNSTFAHQMMYRINVGGNFISPRDDTGGLSRVWSEDSPYLVNDDTRTTIIPRKVSIKYSSSVPSHIAPPKVYATARTPLYYHYKNNLTWFFPVDGNFCYFVRLHFCEIVGGINQRIFEVYLADETVENHADVFNWGGGVGVPTYRDYIVNFTGHNLSLVLQSTSRMTNGPILNGLEIFKLSDIGYNLAGPFPFQNGKVPHHLQNVLRKNQRTMMLIPAVIIFALLVLPFLCYTLLHFPIRWCPLPLVSLLQVHSKWKKRALKQWEPSDIHRYFTLMEIKGATNNFSDANLIGVGGFGNVYKGCINDGTTLVAIKRGNPTSHQGLHEFQTEITMLSKLRHQHLVSLIGYCMDGKELILVYDFMARGSLRNHLYNTQKPPLPWKRRLEICIGTARGLHYLHAGTKQNIIHRDVKTTNILLDKRWVAKVADFGLSKFGPSITSHNSHVSTAVKGTFGYLDPEYYRRQKLTEKSDVYSFGVVLMEVLCARPAVLLPMVFVEGLEGEELEHANLADWALRCHKSETLHQIMDPYLKGKIDPECFKTYTEIAVKCLADRGSERPTMGGVLWHLELAWQQQMKAAANAETRTCVNPDGGTGEMSLRINGDCQCRHGIGNSDPTPGAEFSELVSPIGR